MNHLHNQIVLSWVVVAYFVLERSAAFHFQELAGFGWYIVVLSVPSQPQSELEGERLAYSFVHHIQEYCPLNPLMTHRAMGFLVKVEWHLPGSFDLLPAVPVSTVNPDHLNWENL